MEISNLFPHIEALIFASDKPLTSAEITDLINGAFGFMEDKVVPEQVDAALEGIIEKYNSEFYPFEVRMSGGGWQFLTKKDYHKTVAQLNGEKFLKRLSAAALETLAIVAYKQPVTKGEIEAIRGVSSDYAVQKLLEKELIIITGRNEKLPGHPLVYATSKNFMDYFGINSPEDLPKIREVLADQIVQPTVMGQEVEETPVLLVSGDGDLISTDETPSVNGHTLDAMTPEEDQLQDNADSLEDAEDNEDGEELNVVASSEDTSDDDAAADDAPDVDQDELAEEDAIEAATEDDNTEDEFPEDDTDDEAVDNDDADDDPSSRKA